MHAERHGGRGLQCALRSIDGRQAIMGRRCGITLPVPERAATVQEALVRCRVANATPPPPVGGLPVPEWRASTQMCDYRDGF